MAVQARKEISEILSYSLPPGGLIRLMHDHIQERIPDMPNGGKVLVYSGAAYLEAVRLGCLAYIVYEGMRATGILK